MPDQGDYLRGFADGIHFAIQQERAGNIPAGNEGARLVRCSRCGGRRRIDTLCSCVTPEEMALWRSVIFPAPPAEATPTEA